MSSDAAVEPSGVLPPNTSITPLTLVPSQQALTPLEIERICRILVRFAERTEEIDLEQTTPPTVPTKTE